MSSVILTRITVKVIRAISLNLQVIVPKLIHKLDQFIIFLTYFVDKHSNADWLKTKVYENSHRNRYILSIAY
jgi:hypothetical protein